MKKIALFIAGIFLILNYSSCILPDDNKESHLDDYFDIEHADLVHKDFPDPSSSSQRPVIVSATGTASVIPGGTSTIHLETDRDIEYILVGVEGEFGYYKLPASYARNVNYEFYLMLSQDLNDKDFVILVAVEDADGLISDTKTINVTYVEAGTGVLQVNCSWDQPNDVDLHLIEPNGEEIYYGNSTSQNGGELDVDSNAGCNIDNINNENITYDSDDVLEAGEYIVKVYLYSNCSVSGDTHYVVTAYHNGHILTPDNNTPNPYSGSFTSNSNYIQEVMHFHINPNRATKVYRFNYNNKPKVLSPHKLHQ